MKNMKFLCSILLLLGVAVSGAALADHGRGGGHGGHGRVGIGLYFGMPYGYPYYPPYYSPYYYPPYYYPPVIVRPVPVQPPVYIEQASPSSNIPPDIVEPTADDDYYWYHCDKPDAYYPYIKECPGGWQKVTPTPPAQP